MASPFLEPIRVCVTGAAGQISYSLLFGLCKGDVFGMNQPIILQLLDISMMMEVLKGVVMELDDCAFPLLAGVVITDDAEVAFKDADIAFLLGAMPRKQGMERKDLLEANARIFKVQGDVINRVAKKSVLTLVVGNPANTNALITSLNAPSIPKEQFSCLTQLDHNRAIAQIAQRAKVSPKQVKNVIIWGNHSATQYPDVSHCVITNPDGTQVSAREVINDDAYLHGEFVQCVQTRGAAVINARKLSSALSAAKAIGDHMRYWWLGTPEGVHTSMGIVSDGSYGISQGLFYSFPVTIKDRKISIVQGLQIDEFSRSMMEKTSDELLLEREAALTVIDNKM